ncbi:cleavage and polyadenylation specificity factor subunit 3 [Tribonema minus]|uniref:Cleavage and polyadenylation specificity factor subunit 3 n=1 Tax=Tribonema minus TaxID=303371 RepID=A0A836CKW9_9STRA|nr:cleavage and polyadenylation specificity factor subunit 3 [Tribonema minus]
MTIMPIGAGNEVGRSCIIIKYMGKTIMLDCGIHPGYNGMAALPFFDEIEPEDIDLLLVTHFHLDHAASLPYFTEHTGFSGRIFMTHPTKAVMRMLLADYIKLVNVSSEDILYDEKDLSACIEKIELIDYHQVLEHEGIKFWCYNAGHVLGAAMFMLEIAGVHILYTGDYSMEDDRHLMAAEVPSTSPDVLIVESTYGVQVHSPREEREERFTSTVAQIVRRGGRCLIPVFALGRAQELLLILDEYWQAHPDLQHIPIYYASRLASKAIRVYQTYINMMNAHIRRQMDVSNPFKFKHITNLKGIEHFQDLGPSVVMASPGMLQSGVSRQLFDRWCTDDKNGVLIPGYSVEGTLAKKILSSPDEVTGMDGRIRPLRCGVEYVSFSAHVDYVENKRFMDATAPANIVLVHGEANEMMRLRGELVRKYSRVPAAERPQVLAPRNCQEIRLEFHRDKMAKAVGRLTETLRRPDAAAVGALLVTKDFNNRLMAPEDLETYTQLKVGGVRQSLRVPFYSSFDALRLYFAEVYDDVVVEKTGEATGRMSVHGAAVTVDYPPVQQDGAASLVFEWSASPVNDMIADSLIALAMQAQTTPGAIRLTSAAVAAAGNGQRHARCRHGATAAAATAEATAEEAAAEEAAGVAHGLAAALTLVTAALRDSFGAHGVKVDEATRTLAVSLDDAAPADAAAAEPTALVVVEAAVSRGGGAAWAARVQSDDATVKEQLEEMLKHLQRADAPA